MWQANFSVSLIVIFMNFMHLQAQNDKNGILNRVPEKVTTLIRDFFHLSPQISDTKKETAVILGLINVLHPGMTGNSKDVKRAKRRNSVRRYSGHKGILGVPRYPEDLPAAEPILPGHTLLRPSRGMLKSAVKYPLRDFGGSPVYGNLDNLGITWGKTRDRIRYSNFRKANNLMAALNNAQNRKSKRREIWRPLLIIEIDPTQLGVIKEDVLKELIESQVSREDNDAREVLDNLDAVLGEDSNEFYDLRRKSKSKFRDRKKYYDHKDNKSNDSLEISCGSNSDDTSSSSSEIEKNPGNPYTIHKNKYYQNWMWNHVMDGDHMNINPYAPSMNDLEPSGAKLFFGRKWWYFNQDDYKPLRRR